MFPTLNEHLAELQYFFEYTEIDEKSLKSLEKLHLEKFYQNQIPSKWCINIARQIAFMEIKYASSSIVRGAYDECYYKFLFFLHDAYGTIEIFCSECIDEIYSSELHYSEMKKTPDISEIKIISLLREAITAQKKARNVDYEIWRLLRDAENLKSTYISIIHGSFSNELQEIIDSVSEVANIDLKFRKICLEHFTEHNLGIGNKKVYGFYLYDDEKSFEIFDVIMWIYLHKYSSLSRIIDCWDKISNNEIHYKMPKEIFSIGGDKKFFCECYINDRIEKKIILVENDTIRFSEESFQRILDKLKKIV